MPETATLTNNLDFAASAAQYVREFRLGIPRSKLFQRMILDDLMQVDRATVLDIGCGHGFDGRRDLQAEIAASCHAFYGVEPDTQVVADACLQHVYRCCFEEAEIPADSIDVAYAVMVLEHIREPERFWGKLAQVLRPGGVFWSFTMDRRHYFTWISQLTEQLRLKSFILTALHGTRGEERYENYPTHYRANCPRVVSKQATVAGFARCDSLSLGRIGQLDFYVPRRLRPLSHAIDRAESLLRLPGSLLVTRIQK